MARMRRHALQALRAGITAVRDLGDRDYLALAVRDEYVATGATAPEITAHAHGGAGIADSVRERRPC